MVKSFKIIGVALFVIPIAIWLVIGKATALNENDLEEYISQSQ